MKTLYIWLVAMIQTLINRFKGGLPAAMEEETKLLKLNLNLQFFADASETDGSNDDADDEDDSDNDDSGDEDDAPNLDELLKDRAFKKQYNARLKEQLSKRMKKHDEEIERLKGDKSKSKKKDESGDDESDLAQELKDKTTRLERAERREKRAMVKEFAADNGHNPKLLARLINIDDIELDDDGEPENLNDLFDDLEEEFPEYFGADDEDEDDEPAKRKRSSFTPGARQKGNKKKKVDPKEAGRLKALERHKKEEK